MKNITVENDSEGNLYYINENNQLELICEVPIDMQDNLTNVINNVLKQQRMLFETNIDSMKGELYEILKKNSDTYDTPTNRITFVGSVYYFKIIDEICKLFKKYEYNRTIERR